MTPEDVTQSNRWMCGKLSSGKPLVTFFTSDSMTSDTLLNRPSNGISNRHLKGRSGPRDALSSLARTSSGHNSDMTNALRLSLGFLSTVREQCRALAGQSLELCLLHSGRVSRSRIIAYYVNPPQVKIRPHFNLRAFPRRSGVYTWKHRSLTTARVLERPAPLLGAWGYKILVGPWWRRCRERRFECFDRSVKLPISYSTICPRPGVWMESAGMGNGYRRRMGLQQTAGAGAPCNRPAEAILPKEKMLLLIRCRCSNRRLLMKPRVGVGIESWVQADCRQAGWASA
jgi:hypothetical protein